MATGRICPGGRENTLYYAVNENPWFVRAGAVLPLASERISSLQEASNELRLFVAPGPGDCEIVTTEDDGRTQA